MNCSLAGLVRHFNNRISEAGAAWMMIGIAVLISMNPAAADAHSFDLIGVAIVDDWLAPAFLTVGVVRMAALIANGNWPVYGPWMRAGGALLGALIWSQMCLSLVILALPSPGIPIYAVLTGSELISIYRALAGHHGSHNR
ncbi:MAG: hypothetical protein WBH00_06815 [Xanthobacteraceae bacterium]